MKSGFRVFISTISQIILCYLQQPLWAQGILGMGDPAFHEHCFCKDIFTLNVFGKAGSFSSCLDGSRI